MSIKYFANRVKETTTTTGSGNLVLSGPVSGHKTFISAIGQNNKLTYYIYRQDTNFEWEIGVGYVFSSGGVHILVREEVESSSNGDTFVSFSTGTKFVETIISEDRINTSLLNTLEKTGNFTAEYMPAIYVIDASATGIQVSLPEVATQNNPITIGFILNKTTGDQYIQPNAIMLLPSGSETINGTGFYDISIRDDYLQIMSLPNQSGWVLMDPVQDSTNPYGDNGSIQVKYDNSFSGINAFNWDFINSSLLIGGTGTITSADIIIPTGSLSTVIFNEQSHSNDFRVEGSGNTHLLFIDGSENKIALNTNNAYDSLTINAQYGNGISVYRSGVGPKIVISNTSASGNATNDIIGEIVFSGLNNSGNTINYSRIYSTIQSTANNSESSSIDMAIIKNGTAEPVLELGASGLTMGFNNSNIDGIIIGDVSQNEGTNVVIGYYQNICGQNCVSIGHNGTLASGTFGGLIGTDHSSSGNNIWIVGGSGVNISGSNSTYLAIDNNNYISISQSGKFKHNTFYSGNQILELYNAYTLSSGIDQYINFNFTNTSGVAKTGLSIGSRISDPTNLSEDTAIFASILSSGLVIDILNIASENINIGNSTVSGNNIVFGIDNSISGINNSIFGTGINGSGNNNIIFGNDILHSGNNTIILGKNITCSTSGNVGISIIGNNNTADEDYVSVFGNSNSASGLYSVAVGYLNGVHGEYSVGIGESNLILTDGSVSVGNNNTTTGLTVDASSFIIGIGNNIEITNTGLIFGYNNQIYGSGGMVIGQNILSSGNNNITIGNASSVSGINNIIIGNNRSIIGTGIIDIFSNSTNGLLITNTGMFLYSDTNFTFDSDTIINGLGTFTSGILSSGNIYCAQTGSFEHLVVGTGAGGNAVKIFAINDFVSVGTSVWNSGSMEVTDEGDFRVNAYPGGTGYKVIDVDNDGLYATGNFTSFSTDELILPSMVAAASSGTVQSLYYQNNKVKYNDLATSGTPVTPLQLTSTDEEYQFLYPTGNSYVYLPNGTGLYIGKKFTIVNLDNTFNYIYLRKSGDVSDFATIANGYNMSVVHAGSNNWVKLSDSVANT